MLLRPSKGLAGAIFGFTVALVIIVVDLIFFQGRPLARLLTNVIIVSTFGTIYVLFLKR